MYSPAGGIGGIGATGGLLAATGSDGIQVLGLAIIGCAACVGGLLMLRTYKLRKIEETGR